MKAPAIKIDFDKDLEVKVDSLLVWYERKWPEKSRVFKQAVEEKRQRLHKESGMSKGGTLMMKAMIPAEIMSIMPGAFNAAAGDENFWTENKGKIISKFWKQANAFCINQTSQPQVKAEGDAL